MFLEEKHHAPALRLDQELARAAGKQPSGEPDEKRGKDVIEMATYYCQNTPHGISKSGNRIKTVAHFDYIMREGKYQHMADREEDLVYTENGNTPIWAKNQREFWDEADAHSRANGRVYREVRLGLQEEFSLEENLEVVHEFMDYFGISKNHAYSLAIHDKLAAFDKEHRNIHCHLMFDEHFQDDRRLSKDECFKRYSKNKEGERVGGWKKDSYFSEKQSVIDMRKKWEELCNAKFKELGIDKQISCESLKTQKKQLEEKGLTEEAFYFDREPVPHLGGLYRRPENMAHILELRREMKKEIERMNAEDITKEAEEKAKKTEENDAELTEAQLAKRMQEQKMILFVADQLFRETAKKIQMERLKLREEREAEKMRAEHRYLGDGITSPIIVTAGDVCDKIKDMEDGWIRKINENKTAAKECEARILTGPAMRAAVLEKLFSGEYDAAIKRREEMRKIMKKVGINKLPDELKKGALSWQEEQRLNKEIARMDAEVSGARAFEYNRYMSEQQKENEKAQKERDGYLAKIPIWEKKYDFLHNKRLALEREMPEDRILYAEKLPKFLYKNAKLDGAIPLDSLPSVLYASKSFVLIDAPKNGLANGTQIKARAVLLGDDVNRGKADVYELNVTVEKFLDRKGNIRTNFLATGGKMTDEKVNLYAPREAKIRAMRAHESKQRTPELPAQSRQNALEALLNEAFQTPTARLTARWNDEDRRIGDEVEKAEKEMEAFAAGIHIGGYSR